MTLLLFWFQAVNFAEFTFAFFLFFTLSYFVRRKKSVEDREKRREERRVGELLLIKIRTEEGQREFRGRRSLWLKQKV